MKLVTRLATMAVAIPLALGAATGSAHAAETVTLPGCWGGGTNAAIVCNLTVTVGVPYDVETYQSSVPVCAGTCQNVPVTLARATGTGEALEVCYSYTNGAGTPVGNCYSGADADPYVDLAVDLANRAVEILIQEIEDLNEEIDELPQNVVDTLCARIANPC